MFFWFYVSNNREISQESSILLKQSRADLFVCWRLLVLRNSLVNQIQMKLLAGGQRAWEMKVTLHTSEVIVIQHSPALFSKQYFVFVKSQRALSYYSRYFFKNHEGRKLLKIKYCGRTTYAFFKLLCALLYTEIIYSLLHGGKLVELFSHK